MKRLLALSLAVILILSTAGCKKQEPSITSSADGSSAADRADLTTSAGTGSNLSSAAEHNSSADAPPSSSVPGKKNTTTASVTSTVPPKAVNSTVSEPTGTAQQPAEEPTDTGHKALSKSSYYGYGLLNADEKKLYDQIDSAVNGLRNIVNISSKNISWDDVEQVFSYYWSDHPEAFWLYRSYFYVDAGSVRQIILIYMDGTVLDTLNTETGQWTKTASRLKIAAQIKSYRKKLTSFLKEIDPSLSTFAKEKKIHDAIIRRVTYDDSTSGSVGDELVYSSYGALINGRAVCEGYAKLFQHLCYEVGINCIQVSGDGFYTDESGKLQTEPHMWNAVRLDDGWYLVDVTWDDAFEEDFLYYRYFNLTTRQMAEDHKVTADPNTLPSYPVPSCTAETYHYYNRYCINIRPGQPLPANAESLLRWAAENEDGVLYIVFPDGMPSENVQQNCLFGKTNSVESALKASKLGYRLGNEWWILDETVVQLEFKKK